MMSPGEAVGFKKVVMSCFESRELVQQFERLSGMSIHSRKALKRFVLFVRKCVWDRMGADTKQALCQAGGGSHTELARDVCK